MVQKYSLTKVFVLDTKNSRTNAKQSRIKTNFNSLHQKSNYANKTSWTWPSKSHNTVILRSFFLISIYMIYSLYFVTYVRLLNLNFCLCFDYYLLELFFIQAPPFWIIATNSHFMVTDKLTDNYVDCRCFDFLSNGNKMFYFL